MSKNNERFWSITELLIGMLSVGEVVTAIEREGFYSIDSFGRPIKVTLQVESTDERAILDLVFNELRKGIVSPFEESNDYFYNLNELSVLSYSGWYDSNLPDFKAIYSDWKIKNHGVTQSSDLKAPSKQSKAWDVLIGLLKMYYGDDIINDLNSKYSKRIGEVIKDLELQGISIEPKTLKSYIKLVENKNSKS